MAVEPKNLEWSLAVPSVQEFALQQLDKVPSRYVRDDMDDILTVQSDRSICVPLIDMTKLVNQESQAMELQRLHSACKDWGLFQLINHGVSDETLGKIRKEVEEFFELPLKEKERWAHKPGSLEGYGHAFVTSQQQKLEWSDMIFLKVLPIENKNLEFWPTKPTKFRETLEDYVEDIKQVVICLMRYIGMGLDVEDEEFYKSYEDGKYDVRMNFYPPCPQPEKVIGVRPHADITGITLLLDCGDTPGLQLLKEGHWVYVQPINGALVVNIGQILEIMSNGIYKSPIHRAVTNNLKERLSIVTFCFPNSSLNHIGPAKELIESGVSPVYKTITQEEYFRRFFDSKLQPKFIETLKIHREPENGKHA